MHQDTDGEAGGRYRSYHPLGPLSNKHRAAVPLAASPAPLCPMTAALMLPSKRPFTRRAPAQVVSQGHGRMQGSCLFVLAPSFNSTRPRDLYPCSAHLDRLPDSGDKNRGFHANSRIGHTVASDAISPVLRTLVGYRSAPASRSSTSSCKQRGAVWEHGKGEEGKEVVTRGIEDRCSQSCQSQG